MTGPEFTAWRDRTKLAQQAAASMLGLNLRTVQRYESGEMAIPKAVALATKWIEVKGAMEGWCGGKL